MMRSARNVILTALGIMFLVGGMAQAQDRPGLPPATITAAENAVKRVRDEQKLPGIAVCVAHQGRRWSAGFGTADLENDVPVTPLTMFRLASISKPITAVAVLQLVEQGKLDLDAPIQTYVPSFPQKRWPISARQLLGHLGGIRHYRPGELDSTRHYTSIVEPLAIFENDTLVQEPGTKYLYSTYGYNLLGAAVEGASGEKFMPYLREHILKPAGMSHLRDDDALTLIPHRAAGYRRATSGELRNAALADTSNKIPGGGLCGTPDDLVAFGEAFLAGKLVKPETVALMTTPLATNAGASTNYGLGWNVGRRSGVREVSHGGAQPRVATLLYTRPERQTVVAIMCNLEGAKLADLARALADLAESGNP